jgi:hypothetical protein
VYGTGKLPSSVILDDSKKLDWCKNQILKYDIIQPTFVQIEGLCT